MPKLTGLPGPSYEYLVFDNSTTTVATLTFPANSLDTSLARLTVRAHLDDTPERLLDNKWEYTSTKQIRLLPAGTNFQQSAIYELTYTARDPVVSGVGLAATRDWVSFLRYASAAEGNPLAAVRVQRATAALARRVAHVEARALEHPNGGPVDVGQSRGHDAAREECYRRRLWAFTRVRLTARRCKRGRQVRQQAFGVRQTKQLEDAEMACEPARAGTLVDP